MQEAMHPRWSLCYNRNGWNSMFKDKDISLESSTGILGCGWVLNSISLFYEGVFVRE